MKSAYWQAGIFETVCPPIQYPRKHRLNRCTLWIRKVYLKVDLVWVSMGLDWVRGFTSVTSGFYPGFGGWD